MVTVTAARPSLISAIIADAKSVRPTFLTGLISAARPAACTRQARPARESQAYGEPAGTSVIRHVLSAGRWAMAVPPSGSVVRPWVLQTSALRLLARARPDAHGWREWEIVRVPQPVIDPRLGPAVLHHRCGRTVVYCADSQL